MEPSCERVAALVYSVNPALSVAQVKDIILSTADPVPSLAGKTVTGGRLNAADAVNATVPSAAAPVLPVFGRPVLASNARGLVERTRLGPAFPSPANPEVWIPYQLANASDVSVRIYAATGNLVRTLELGHQTAGVYESKSVAAHWDGRNTQGEVVPSGVYFYTLTASDFTATRKLLIVR